jgi:phosphatidylglycerophosphate synthase
VTATAILFATTPSEDGSPSADLRIGDGSLLTHLLEQLDSLDVRRVYVVVRPGYEGIVDAASIPTGVQWTVVGSASAADDLQVVADVAAKGRGRLVLAMADVLTHREALAGLLADPRVVTGILATTARLRSSWTFRTRSVRGRIVSAGSLYHQVRRANAYFLGVLKVDERDRPVLASVARELAALNAAHPTQWPARVEDVQRRWRTRAVRDHLVLAAADAEAAAAIDLEGIDVDAFPLGDDVEARLALRRRVSENDVAAMVLVGLVRSGVHLTNSYLRRLFWARPLSQEAAANAAAAMGTYDEDKVLLASAVKANDGFFTTYFVSPYSKYIARWAAHRGWTPNGVTTLSMAIGILAAAAFAIGTRPALVAGAVLLQVAFAFDCVDGQLARYTRQFSKLGAWLDSVLDRGKEYAVYAGLAFGATRGFHDDVWTLAAAALVLQTCRHMMEFSYSASQHDQIAAIPMLPLDQPEDRILPADLTTPEDASSVEQVTDDQQSWGQRALHTAGRSAITVSRLLERRRWMRWGKKIVVLPIGERFALISLTAAIWDPRVTFTVLLLWGSLAASYVLVGRILRSVA